MGNTAPVVRSVVGGIGCKVKVENRPGIGVQFQRSLHAGASENRVIGVPVSAGANLTRSC